MPYFPFQVQKEEKNQNLLFLLSSVQEGVCKRKPKTKEERLGNDEE